MTTFLAILRRDVRLAFRQGGTGAMTVIFFVIAVTLFPLGVGPEREVLARLSAGVVWVAALLAAMLSLDRLYQADFEDNDPAPILTTGIRSSRQAPIRNREKDFGRILLRYRRGIEPRVKSVRHIPRS